MLASTISQCLENRDTLTVDNVNFIKTYMSVFKS